MKKYLRYSTAGQITALIINQPANGTLASNLMNNDATIEQVGFISYLPTLHLQMMGGELCVNASLAAGDLFCEKFQQDSVSFYTSGIDQQVTARKNNGLLSLYLPATIIKNVDKKNVDLSGISFFIEKGLRQDKKLSTDEKTILQSIGMTKGAAGYIFYEGDTIQPVVYVGETCSMVWESACGSGSLAYYLITGISNILQPSGETIRIKKNNDTLTISASVKEIT